LQVRQAAGVDVVSEIDHGGLGVHAERCGDKLGPLVAATRSFSRDADMAHNRARGFWFVLVRSFDFDHHGGIVLDGA